MPRVAFCCILVYFGVFLTFWCILVHSAAFWSILVHFGAFWCISVPVHLDAFFGALGARFRAWRRGGPPWTLLCCDPCPEIRESQPGGAISDFTRDS